MERQIAEEFLTYLEERDLIKTWDRSDLAIHFQDFRSERRLLGKQNISLSKALYALSHFGRRELRVQNGVTVIFRGTGGFNNRISQSQTGPRQTKPEWKIKSECIDIKPVSEQTSETKPGHFLRKLTSTSPEFAVIELEITNKSEHFVSLELKLREYIGIDPFSRIRVLMPSPQEAEVCSTELGVSIIVHGEAREYIMIYLKYEMVDVNNLSDSDGFGFGENDSPQCISFYNFVEGEKPDMLYENSLQMKLSLPPCKVSQELKNTIKRGTFNSNSSGNSLTRSDLLLKDVIRKPLKSENYKAKFAHLLHIEEFKNEEDIKRYDMKEACLTQRRTSGLLYLKVPGLAEKRPSVLRGDRVYVRRLRANGRFERESYEGYVHHVEQEEVGLGFNQSIKKTHIANMKYYVRFAFNRLALKLMHRSVAHVDICPDKEAILFPDDLLPSIPIMDLKMFNRYVEDNHEQRAAVHNIVNGGTAQVYVIYGPPGTGKTITMVEVIHQILRQNPDTHMLVCAPSNSACDLLTSRLLVHADKREIVRMHAASRNWAEVPEDVKDVSNYQGEFRFPSKEELMKCRIIVTTLVTAGRIASAVFPRGHFNRVFIDEAGQAMEPETMIAVAGILSDQGKIVLAGDPKQLGPIIRSPIANSHGLQISLLERLMNKFQIYQKNINGTYNSECITKLLRNYRSHPTIISVSNTEFYDGQLQVCADEAQRNFLSQWEGLPKENFQVLFHGVQGEDKQESNSPSFFNLQEIKQVKKYVTQLLDIRGKRIKPSDIGVITPYRKQVEKIKKELNNREIKVGSVEEFQGQERRVIVISTVRSNVKHLQGDAKFNLGFLRNPKRFNVAVTRAKALMVIIGNPNILCLDRYWRSMLKYCIDNGGYTGIRFNLNTMDDETNVGGIQFELQALTLSNDESEDQGEDHINPQWRQDP